MSEMLGNQYFMSRQFDKALHHLERVLEGEPENERVKKKLIICYCETGHVRAALRLFEQVITNNIRLIIDTDLVSEDCPCPDILERMNWYRKVAVNSADFHSILGMLNLYCNISESINSFQTAFDLRPEDELLHRIFTKIKDFNLSVSNQPH